jgi:uncharacterized protein
MRRTLGAFALLIGVSALAADMPANMTTYWFGILERGDKWTPGDTPELQQIQEGHLAHLTAMWKAGKLVLAGPLENAGNWRGVLIYRTKTIEEAQALANDDPAVKAGRLKVTLHRWWVQKGILPDPLESPPKPQEKP